MEPEASESPLSCWNGDCLFAGACVPLPVCPSLTPVRCADSRCVASPTECGSVMLPECPLGTVRCGTGECLKKCPRVAGCGVNEGMCPNGVCVALLESDLTGDTNYTSRCYPTQRAGSRFPPPSLIQDMVSDYARTLDDMVTLTVSPFFNLDLTIITSDHRSLVQLYIPSGLLLSRNAAWGSPQRRRRTSWISFR